ncbi:unnamed protein product, partial [Effrenium voratum]
MRSCRRRRSSGWRSARQRCGPSWNTWSSRKQMPRTRQRSTCDWSRSNARGSSEPSGSSQRRSKRRWPQTFRSRRSAPWRPRRGHSPAPAGCAPAPGRRAYNCWDPHDCYGGGLLRYGAASRATGGGDQEAPGRLQPGTGGEHAPHGGLVAPSGREEHLVRQGELGADCLGAWPPLQVPVAVHTGGGLKGLQYLAGLLARQGPEVRSAAPLPTWAGASRGSAAALPSALAHAGQRLGR